MITEAPIQETEITFPELDAVSNESALVLVEFRAIEKIENEGQYRRICQLILDAAANIKRISEHVAPQKEEAHARHARICEVEKRLTSPWVEIRSKGSPMAASWQHTQELERQRKEDEERAQSLKDAHAQQEATANQLADEGRIEDALAELERQPVAAPTVIPKSVPKVSGIGTPRYDYKCKVEDLRALVNAVSKGEAPIQSLCADQSFLDKQANAFRDAFSLPGCKLDKQLKLSSVRAPK